MVKLNQLIQILFFIPLFSVLAAQGSGLNAKNSQLRNDLQALADSGAMTLMSTTWPLPWTALHQALNHLEAQGLSELPPHLHAAYHRLKQASVENKRPLAATAGMSTHSSTNLLNQFSAHEPYSDSLSLGFDYWSPHLSGSIQLNTVNDQRDLQRFQLDQSYILANLGSQWGIGAGSLDRWWGPGWHTSLILSHNARPIPMVFIARQTQSPMQNRWLSWAGPWHLVTFMGQLSSKRTVPNAKLWGMRLTFLPHPFLEIGLSRTAMWAGDNRPSGWSTFKDLLLGQDNFEPGDAGKVTEPGNQLGGIDIRFARPVGSNSFAAYIQVIGEDEAGNLPSRPTVLLGGSATTGLKAGPLTTALEFQDTSLDSYSDPIFNSAYNHGIYQTGYRYRGRSIGSSFDNDTQSLSWGLFLPTSKHWHLSTWLSHIRANRDGFFGNNTVSANALDTYYAKLSATYTHKTHELILAASQWSKLPINTLGRNSKGAIEIHYQFQFGL